ncbi:MAG: sugar ABC transporter permease [Anaerolineaceae bacterium]|nr:sugar ABC transporter permease [Anaerolineaceae bacterium]
MAATQGTIQPGAVSLGGGSRRRELGRWLFILPVVLLNLVVIVGPAFFGVYIAFTDWSGVGSMNFVGLENFGRLLQDQVFWKALRNNLVWTAIFLVVPIVLGLLGAYMLTGIRRGQMFMRVAFFVPYVLPSVVTTHIWRYLMHPRVGLGQWLSDNFGIDFLDKAWLGSRDTALYGIAFMDNWHFWGFPLVLLLAAMSAVDVELYEVARLDGASRFQQFRHVTLPSIRPTLVFLLLMIAIWSALVFDYIFLTTGGGPANASEVMGTHLYTTAFERFQTGYAATIGLVMVLWVALVVGGFVYLRKRGWEI